MQHRARRAARGPRQQRGAGRTLLGGDVSGELSRWDRWHPDTAFPGGRFCEQKGKSLGRREARFINQGLRITRVAFTAPPVPVCCWGMMQSPCPARLCSRSISAPPVSKPAAAIHPNLPFLDWEMPPCAVPSPSAWHRESCPAPFPRTSTSGRADGDGSCR